MIIIQGAMQAEEGGTSALFQRSRVGIGVLQATGVVYNGVQGVGSGQGKVAVKTSQSDVAKVLERGESELHVKKSDRSSGNREDAGQGSIESDLEEAKVGLGVERKEVGQRIHCNRGEPKPIHDHSRSRAEVGGSLPGED
jgi:hypothetical protein